MGGNKCLYQNEYWSKCVPESTSSCSQSGQQCAGPSWAGPACCTSGNKCVYQNEYWSQCVQEGLVEVSSQRKGVKLSTSEHEAMGLKRRPRVSQPMFLSPERVLLQFRKVLGSNRIDLSVEL